MSTQFSLDSLFDGPPVSKPLTGKQLRDSGMESVLANTPVEWKEKLKARVQGFPMHYKFTMEQVVDSLGGRPYEVHPNAIGALTASMVKAGLMRRTGETVKAKRASLHATDCVEWIRL